MERITTYLFNIFLKNILLVVLTTISLAFPYLNTDPVDRVVFLDVGQGDAILITTRNGIDILVDCGPGDYVVQRLGEYLEPGDMNLELVIVTHPHGDHILGLTDILNRYSVENVWYYGDCELYEKIDRKTLVSEGWKYILSNFTLSVIYPPADSSLKLCSGNTHYNEMSIVIQIRFGNYSFLLMGDATIEVEDYLIYVKALNQNVDVLKAGHHCSATSSGRKFLEYVNPRIAICSVGKNNKFGHPSEAVLRLFEELGIKYLSTAIEGDIVIDI